MPKKTGGLGRGLDSLFGDSSILEPASVIQPEKTNTRQTASTAASKNAAKGQAKTASANKPEAAESVVYIKLSDIKANADQPRKVFSQESLEELASSIKEHGVIQPVLLRPAAKGYELVAGERRWRAARLAGLKTIPAIIRELDEKQNAFYALIENMQREDLSIIEEGHGIREIIEKYGLTQDEAAKAVGKSRSYVTNALRIIKLPQEVLDLVDSKKLTAGHAKAIAGLSGSQLQIEAAVKAADEGWSVRQIENYTGAKAAAKKKASKAKSKVKSSQNFKEVEQQLLEKIGSRVKISGSENRGTLEISYYSRDELEGIIEILSK